MTKKSKKGIVGKAIPTQHERYEVGPGIDLIDENLKNGKEIAEKAEMKKKDMGLS